MKTKFSHAANISITKGCKKKVARKAFTIIKEKFYKFSMLKQTNKLNF